MLATSLFISSSMRVGGDDYDDMEQGSHGTVLQSDSEWTAMRKEVPPPLPSSCVSLTGPGKTQNSSCPVDSPTRRHSRYGGYGGYPLYV